MVCRGGDASGGNRLFYFFPTCLATSYIELELGRFWRINIAPRARATGTLEKHGVRIAISTTLLLSHARRGAGWDVTSRKQAPTNIHAWRTLGVKPYNVTVIPRRHNLPVLWSDATSAHAHAQTLGALTSSYGRNGDVRMNASSCAQSVFMSRCT